MTTLPIIAADKWYEVRKLDDGAQLPLIMLTWPVR